MLPFFLIASSPLIVFRSATSRVRLALLAAPTALLPGYTPLPYHVFDAYNHNAQVARRFPAPGTVPSPTGRVSLYDVPASPSTV